MLYVLVQTAVSSCPPAAAAAHLSVFSVAHRVGLSVLDSDGGHSEVTHSFL